MGRRKPAGSSLTTRETLRIEQARMVRSRAWRRYGFLVGNAARTDDEERELHAIRARLVELRMDPGWEPVQNDRL